MKKKSQSGTTQKKALKSKKGAPADSTKKVFAEIVDEKNEDAQPQTSSDEDFFADDEIPIEALVEDIELTRAKPLAESQGAKALTNKSIAKSSSKSIAKSDPVSAYLSEIRKYPLLSKEQEQALAKKYYETKDPAAAQALVTANLRFVVKIAVEYSRFGARLIDLIQEGNMGLMHGVREFNPYKDVRLITYAVWWIRGYIREYLMKQYSLVKIGTTQNQKKLFYQLQRQKEELESLGQSPDIHLLSTRLGIPEDEVQVMAQRMSGRDVSLDYPLGDDSSATFLDFQKSDESLPDEEISKREEMSHLSETINELKHTLSAREKIILEERILNDEPLTLQEIGEKYGITREAVRQMESRLLKKIKDHYQKPS